MPPTQRPVLLLDFVDLDCLIRITTLIKGNPKPLNCFADVVTHPVYTGELSVHIFHTIFFSVPPVNSEIELRTRHNHFPFNSFQFTTPVHKKRI